jgi:hypothetical protein
VNQKYHYIRKFIFYATLTFAFLIIDFPAFSQGRPEDERGRYRDRYPKEGAPFEIEEEPLEELPPEAGELPFPLSPRKRLSRQDVAEKREGWYVTGLPEAGVDPIRGFGLGGNAFIFNNMSREDPFFYYTPYRLQLAVGARVFTNGRVSGSILFDAPYAFNTRWRLRGDLIYASDPNWQYFGLGSQTLGPLQFRDRSNPNVFQSTRRFSNFENQIAILRPGLPRQPVNGIFNEQIGQLYTDIHYNELIYNEFIAAAAAERTYFEGRMRLMFGYELILIGIDHYDGQTVAGAVDPVTGQELEATHGKTKISEDYAAKLRGDENSFWLRYNIGGYNGGRIGLLQSGIMWDTRDLEPDPSRGVFIEYAQEISAPWTGSEFSFSKHLVQAMFFQRLFPQSFTRMVLASRFSLGGIRGRNVPFTEAFDQWGSSEGAGVPTLGGDRSLRGYRESRFAASMAGWANAELRTRLFDVDVLNQHLAFSIVPFYDAGRVWNDFGEFFTDWSRFRGAPGLGARIAWNQATILRFDYSYSREDSQFFFVFGHSF